MQRLAVTVTAAVVALAILRTFPSSADAGPTPPYANHTVGGTTGWLFDGKKNTSAASYSAWAKTQSFFLGDYLILKTNGNMSVVQTYNKTAYDSCDSSSPDISEWSSGAEVGFGVAEVVSVPLTEEGGTYFFSDAEDGVQCAKGMRFSIDVGKGRGLPPSLAQPPPPPYVDPLQPPPPDSAANVVGGSPQEESFYTGGAAAHVGGFWGGICLGAMFLF